MSGFTSSRFAFVAALAALLGCRAASTPVNNSAGSPTMVADTVALARFADSVRAGNFGYIDGMLVVRDGKPIFARSFPRSYEGVYPMTDPAGIFNYHDPNWHPFYQGTSLHTLQSVTKSITSIVFGIALDRGDLKSIDQPIQGFFPEHAGLFSDPRKQQITIRNLLTMTSGIRWPEGGSYDDTVDLTGRMEKSRDWVSVVLEQPMEASPGELWSYSSGSAALLGAVFKAATNRDIQDYAREHLFAPIGISNFYWKRSAGGLTDTEGGLYLDIADVARIGQLYLDRGVWQDRRIVPERWVNESVVSQPRRAADRRDKKYGYGRLWWTLPADLIRDPAFIGWGYGGQYLIVIPNERVVAVMTAWNLEKRRILPEEFASRIEKAVRDRP